MRYNPENHHRRSIRIPEYDYSQEGMYYVTICTWNRECIFGKVENSGMKLSPIGEIIYHEWYNIPNHFKNIELDTFIIMPNHLHGIIIVGASLVGALDNPITQNTRAGTSPAPTLGAIIGSFKSLCVYRCRNKRVDISKLWQRNYFEHIIRNEDELNRIREYIIYNPSRWMEDEDNPANIKNRTTR